MKLTDVVWFAKAGTVLLQNISCCCQIYYFYYTFLLATYTSEFYYIHCIISWLSVKGNSESFIYGRTYQNLVLFLLSVYHYVSTTTTTTTERTWEFYEPKAGRCPATVTGDSGCETKICGDDSHCDGDMKCCTGAVNSLSSGQQQAQCD